jgi:hypothetical protein
MEPIQDWTDPRVQAIRADKLVGYGSCSTIDECTTDEELREKLDEAEVATPEEAIKWAYDYENLRDEQCLNTLVGAAGEPGIDEQIHHINAAIERRTIPSEEV